MDINFIAFLDLTPEAHYLYLSESVSEVLGYTPSELIGRPAYSICHPDEIPSVRLVHASGVQSDKVAVMINMRMLHKENRWVDVEIIFNICYDVIVSSTTLRHSQNATKHKVRSATAEEVNYVTKDGHLELVGWNERQLKMLDAINQRFYWDVKSLSPEPRVCMILNRFTRGLTILFASSASELLLGINPDRAVGTSFYSYVHPDEVESVAEELDVAKANDSIAHLKFSFVSSIQSSILVEAVVSCSSDGLVVVIRKCSDEKVGPTMTITKPETRESRIWTLDGEESARAAAQLGVYIWPSTHRSSQLFGAPQAALLTQEDQCPADISEDEVWKSPPPP